MRRKQWEYRSQAVSVVNAYAEAMAGGKQPAPTAPQAAPRKGLNVGGDAMLKMLGAKGLT